MPRLIIGIAFICCAVSLAQPQESGSDHAKTAQLEYAAVFSRPDNPCHWTDNHSYLQCMSKEIDFTEGHLNTFTAALRSLAADKDTDKTPGTNIKSALDALIKTDASWREYRKNACSLQYTFGTGTGAAPAAAECQLSLDRAYMKTLAGLFNLHELAWPEIAR